MFYVYLLESTKYKQVYIGSTNDLRRRLREHNDGLEISTRRYKPWRLVSYEAYQSEQDAREREKGLKNHGNATKEFKKRARNSLKNDAKTGLPSTTFRNKKNGAKAGLPSTTFCRKSGAGFTLIELLVVITIIGVMASMVLVSLGEARAKARDARRQSDLAQILLAMELDYSDEERYSEVSGDRVPEKIPCSNIDCTGFEDGKYLNPVPLDPRTGERYFWVDNLTGIWGCGSQSYCAYTLLEEGSYFISSERGTRKIDTAPSPWICPCGE